MDGGERATTTTSDAQAELIAKRTVRLLRDLREIEGRLGFLEDLLQGAVLRDARLN